ncbi:MAG: phosphatase PAP2 family protein [Candidatus Pacearchaeota archaeon]|jgi:membrane-associated phospholipid phosphatase
MKKREFIIIFLSLIALIISFLFDDIIISFIKISRNGVLNGLFIFFGYFLDPIIIFFLVIALFLLYEKKRKWILPIGLTIIISSIFSLFLKIIIKRPRPFQEQDLQVLKALFYFIQDNFNKWNFSFPSYSSVFVFSILPFINKEFNKFRYIWIVIASLVALSGTYFGESYLSDTIGGALIGYLIGYSILKTEEKYQLTEKIYKIR